MYKKLQVFVSSTYTDLATERQVAVEAILNAGHIPAGMELFKAGDESQKETIKRWIDESDVYMLILGGRYGAIEDETGKSYTHWEYDYAGKAGKPRFAVVIKEDALEAKVQQFGTQVMEKEYPQKYQEFRKEVLSKTSRFFSDEKDIKIAILESLKEQEKNKGLKGWVSGENSGNLEKILQENLSLVKENIKLRERIKQMELSISSEKEFDGFSYEDIEDYLINKKIMVPLIKNFGNLAGQVSNLFEIFMATQDLFSIGIDNDDTMDEVSRFLFFNVAPNLLAFNLLEKQKVAGEVYQRIQLSNSGQKFIAMYEMERHKKSKKIVKE
ncbi:DUF4062 domain-containing protein [Bacillus subtilis]|uniref:DUF4062 domain-containing protein n=1 Tax=Bacillus subtilis TaxID=1423 RepID=UPI001E59545A|nr:DUF4062 domain-containing protein [Bacillus subtilis]MCT6513217.1 DUF4062 domain-containing protein [Bacillus subtilis]MCX4076910.1 DUF4062 domain-containing protein [Bacillus subtilis]MEC0435384.1 DUF4062 domain-containing protein [Bacillus subtilis]WRU03932.1 DUF4062 domain-containing protein [Bacillus subtilis]